MSNSDNVNVIVSYTLEQAVADGVLVQIFKNRWMQLSGGKPIVATTHLFEEVSAAGLMEIWNEYVRWRKEVMPTLPEEEQMFKTRMNGRDVWVIEDGAHLPFSILRITSFLCPPRNSGGHYKASNER